MNTLTNTNLVTSSIQIFLTIVLCLCSSAGMAADCCEVQKEFINSNQSFTQVVTVSSGGVKTLYVSGQVGIQDGQVPESFTEQVDTVFANMARQLEAAGATMADVIKLTGFIVDIDPDKVAQYGQVRSRHFPAANPPASTLVGVSGLVRESFLVEVEAVAVISD